MYSLYSCFSYCFSDLSNHCLGFFYIVGVDSDIVVQGSGCFMFGYCYCSSSSMLVVNVDVDVDVGSCYFSYPGFYVTHPVTV